MSLYEIDLHGIEHEDARDKIVKFVTDHIATDTMPVKVITGKSRFFINLVKSIAKEYELEYYMDKWVNDGCWVLREKSRVTTVFE
tara:strand:+ start:112 stop:366 length:255 start_codon:yes stop_codon:yes gene_type:complete